MITVEPKIVDLFSGCGGFGLGAELAGFRSVAAIDIDQNLQSAYRANFPGTRSVQTDIATLDKSGWAFILGDQKIDGVIGGPPCQGFSRIGKRNKEDPRNTLIGHFFRHVGLLQPKFFVMENVEGLLDGENIQGLEVAIESVSKRYVIVGPIIINALHFGAPTSRRRVIVVGFNSDYMDDVSSNELIGDERSPRITVSDAIRDLPSPVSSKFGHLEYGWARYPNANHSDTSISPYARYMRSSPSGLLGLPIALERLANGQTSGHFATVHTPAVTERFANTLAGKTEPISRYPRLAWNGHCPTLRAGTGAERGSFQAMRPIHPSEPRVITVREAARLQGFPDWFVFHQAKWHSFRMIGNSVSPFVSKGILSVIMQKVYGDLVDTRERA